MLTVLSALLLSAPAFAQDAPADEAPMEEAAPAGPVTYTLNPANSFLGVKVLYDRNALIAGHDHVMVPSSFDGKVTWSEDLSSCDVSISFPVTALQVDPGNSRSRVGFEGATKDGDKVTIKKNFEGKSQLNASANPTISYKSTSCKAAGDKVAVTGKLSIAGVSKSITTNMAVTADGSTFSAKGNQAITATQFGFSPFSALLGSLRNDDNMTLVIDVKGAK